MAKVQETELDGSKVGYLPLGPSSVSASQTIRK